MIMFFWVLTLCRLVGRCIGAKYRLRFQGLSLEERDSRPMFLRNYGLPMTLHGVKSRKNINIVLAPTRTSNLNNCNCTTHFCIPIRKRR